MLLRVQPDPLLFPKLSADQLRLLSGIGELRRTSIGDVLFREGDRPPGLIAVLEGSVVIVDHDDHGSLREVAVEEAGGFVAELALLTGQRAFASGVVRVAGEVVIVPADDLKELIARDQALGA
jgi:thioredoxin reductase (NADPH)